MKNIVGRKQEIEQFNVLKSGNTSAFVAVYGRRRVGKTFLIREAFGNKFTFQLTGLARASLSQQLANFQAAFQKYNKHAGHTAPSNWFDAFQELIQFLEQKKERKIIFIDELPWLDTVASGFVAALEHFWNSWASARKDVVLIVCGSAASWMINKLINNKGGLHNRVTHRIKLEPFTLKECEVFFKKRSAVFDRHQLVQLYMVMGGIPFYLEQVDTGLSAAQNINNLCFTPTGLLQNEFNNLYASLFKKADNHIAIIEALASKAKGLGREQLLKIAGIPNGGGATRLLKELEESSFIRRYNSFGKRKKNSLYQLTDFYSLFYLKFIKNTTAVDENIWINSLDTPQYRAWSGYAFEQVCLHHLPAIKKALGISGIQTKSGAWLGNTAEKGAQIDLIIDRRDHVINICEMKFSIEKYTITKKYAAEIRNKIALFKAETDTKKAIYFTMLTSFGLVQNNYATALVQNNLTMDVLFG